MGDISPKTITDATTLLVHYGIPEHMAPVMAADVAAWARFHVHQKGLIGKLGFVFSARIMQICNNVDSASHVNRSMGGPRANMANLEKGLYEPEEMRPDIWQEHIEEYEKKEELVWTRECETVDTEECERCGKREVWLYIMQLRSLDEGTTMRVICKPCGHAWTHNN